MTVVSQNPPPYGAVPPSWYPPREHPSATTVLVLGILGLVTCQVLSPFAWAMGSRVGRELDASGGQLGGRSSANAGRICGIVGTVLLGVSVVALVAFVGLFVVGSTVANGAGAPALGIARP